MGYPGRLAVPALTLGLLTVPVGAGLAQPLARQPERVTEIAAVAPGRIVGHVRDDAGQPIEGVVVSALGSSSAFAISDSLGQFSLRQLPPGPYLVRAHREGYLSARGTIVEVRPAAESPSAFILARQADASAPRLAEAGLAPTAIGAAPGTEPEPAERSETGLAWRLRRLKRSVLRDVDTMAAVPDDDFSFKDSFDFLGRALEQSARAAGALLADINLDGQVDLLTTGAFDSPGELLQMGRTRGVAFFSVGSNVGDHGAWVFRAATNQSDLDSWMMAGSYTGRAGASHRYQAGTSYSFQGFQGANTVLSTIPDANRSVGTVFGYDDWSVSRRLSVSYGAHFAFHNYLSEPALLSPRLSVSYMAAPGWRVRGLASREMSAPGAQEFLPPTRASWLPPQRTFAALSRDGFRTQALTHYEAGVDRLFGRGTLSARMFRQQVDNQLVTLFGVRPDGVAEAFGHYYVGTMGNAAVDGVGAAASHAFTPNVRASVEYSFATAEWAGGPPAADAVLLARMTPELLPARERQNIHDVLTSVEAAIPQTATRLVIFYRLNNAFADTDPDGSPDGRFALQVNQSLPFMSFMRSEWEMLVAVRNMFFEPAPGASVFDEILVIRPPKRMVGGLTVRF